MCKPAAVIVKSTLRRGKNSPFVVGSDTFAMRTFKSNERYGLAKSIHTVELKVVNPEVARKDKLSVATNGCTRAHRRSVVVSAGLFSMPRKADAWIQRGRLHGIGINGGIFSCLFRKGGDIRGRF